MSLEVVDRLTAPQVAKILCVSPQTVRELVKQKKITALKVGARFLFDLNEVNRFIADNTTGQG